MKALIRLVFILFITIPPFLLNTTAQEVTAKDIIDYADKLMRGNSSYAEMEMTIIRPKWKRTLRFKSWSKGIDYSLIYITYPANEKGQTFLKRQKEMWNYIPSIERMIKIPAGMMMQSWMGSDLTNDDLIKGASIVEDYTHHIIKTESVQGYDCYVIKLIPKVDAAVVWGKILSWVTKEGYMTLKNEYYDEDGFLINRETLGKIKDVGDRIMPTYFEIIPIDKQGHKTVMEFTNLKFEIPLKDNFFSIQNMKRIH